MSMQHRLGWFSELQKSQSHAVTEASDLLLELEMAPENYQQLKAATTRYLVACLGKGEDVESEEDLMKLIEGRVDQLANRTPNGILMPKKELEDEFNGLHQALSSYVKSLDIDDLIFGASCPIIVRMVKGSSDKGQDDRPFSSTKIHLDSWAGDPGDEVVVSIPVMGDISRTTVEYFQPPLELEDVMLRTMSSYEEGQELMGERSSTPLQQRAGYAYFMDTIVPHRTVKQGGGVRVTVEFRLRRNSSDEERLAVENACEPGRLTVFINTTLWHCLGSTKRMSFADTYADAKRGIFTERPYDEPIYTVVDV